MENLVPQHGHYLRSGSAPIEIPSRRRSTTSPIHSPVAHSPSSDLLFDMSPDLSHPLQLLHYEPGPHALKAEHPYMYKFPTLTSKTNPTPPNKDKNERTEPRPIAIRAQALPLGTGTNKIAPRSPMVATTKISGFEPLNTVSAGSPSSRARRPSGHLRRTVQRLSPPPRSSSYSSSPWILIGDGGLDDEDVSSEDLNYRALEFETYLLRRIDDPTFKCVGKSLRRPGRHHELDFKRSRY